MTVEQLNATPLWSTVTYTAKTAITGTQVTIEGVILKIRNNEARVWDVTNGHLSYYIPAATLTLKQKFVAGSMPAYTNFLTMPLYSIVSYKGAKGFLIEKEIIQNEFIPDGSGDIENGTLWFIDEEIVLNAIPASQFTFVEPPSAIITKPDGLQNALPGKTNYILYGAIAIGAYFLFFRKEKGPTA